MAEEWAICHVPCPINRMISGPRRRHISVSESQNSCKLSRDQANFASIASDSTSLSDKPMLLHLCSIIAVSELFNARWRYPMTSLVLLPKQTYSAHGQGRVVKTRASPSREHICSGPTSHACRPSLVRIAGRQNLRELLSS